MKKIWWKLLSIGLTTILVTSLTTILFSSKVEALDLSHNPSINTVSGPTSVLTGSTVTYNANITSVTGYDMTRASIYVTQDVTTSNNSTSLGTSNVPTDCTSTSCNVTANFTPNAPGTYYIWVIVSYNGTSCNSHPAATETHCLNGNGKYITVTVSNTLPNTAVSTTTLVFSAFGLIALAFFVQIIYIPSSTIIHNQSIKTFEARFNREK
jgi:hypothetical protein